MNVEERLRARIKARDESVLKAALSYYGGNLERLPVYLEALYCFRDQPANGPVLLGLYKAMDTAANMLIHQIDDMQHADEPEQIRSMRTCRVIAACLDWVATNSTDNVVKHEALKTASDLTLRARLLDVKADPEEFVRLVLVGAAVESQLGHAVPAFQYFHEAREGLPHVMDPIVQSELEREIYALWGRLNRSN